MRLLLSSVTVATTIGLVGFQSYVALTPAPRETAAPAGVDIEHIRELGASLAVAPIDLRAPGSYGGTPLTRTGVLAPAPERAAPKPRPAAGKSATSTSRASKATPTSAAKPAPRPVTRQARPAAATSSFAAALSRSNYTRTDFGFRGVQRDTTKGRTVRTVRR